MTPTNQRAVELAPCPFCGGTDLEVFGDRPNEAMLGGFNVCCRNPGCQSTCRHSGDRNKAIAAWNRRAPGWRPISEAPTVDGLKILGAKPGWESAHIFEWDADFANWWSCDPQAPKTKGLQQGVHAAQPTVWQPLPPPPGEG